MLAATSGAASAGCAESVALLAKQVELIGDAAPLVTDPNASPGPPDTLLTRDNPALTERTSMAFDVFKSPPVAEPDRPDWGFPANLARARESLDNARSALERSDTAACEEAVNVGYAAATRARTWIQ
jgi:hypothetical protein